MANRSTPHGANHTGWFQNDIDNTLDMYRAGTKVGAISSQGLALSTGRLIENLTVVDDDSQNMTLAAADIVAGINVHTSTSAGGTITVDTATNIIANVPLNVDNQAVVSYFINDGNQTDTFAVATGTTISDVTNTVLTNSAATLLWVRTSSTAVVLHIINST